MPIIKKAWKKYNPIVETQTCSQTMQVGNVVPRREKYVIILELNCDHEDAALEIYNSLYDIVDGDEDYSSVKLKKVDTIQFDILNTGLDDRVAETQVREAVIGDDTVEARNSSIISAVLKEEQNGDNTGTGQEPSQGSQ